MIIKYTFKDNDYTQIIEKHLDEFGPFLAMSYNTISEHKEFIENVRKYNEMSINNTERKELKQKLVKTIKQAFKNYINSIKPNSNWQTDGINAEDLNDSKQYIFENIKIDIVNSISDKWQNGEVVYYFTSNQKYLTM